MPMSKFSTLNYLFNSYYAGKKEVEFLQTQEIVSTEPEFGPSQKSIEAIISFASQYEVLKSSSAGTIELNLN